MECAGFTTVLAHDTVPAKVIANEITIDPVAGFNSDGLPIGNATICFDDVGDANNFYEVTISMGESTLFPLSSSDAAIKGESYYPQVSELNNYQPKRLLFSDRAFNGETKSISIQFIPNASQTASNITAYGGLITVSFRHVSQSYFRYYTSLLDYRFNKSGDILMGKTVPQNIFSNIEEGMGIFGFYTEYKKEEYIEQMVF